MAKPRAKTTAHLHGCPTCKDTFRCNCREAKTTDPRCIPCIGNHSDSFLASGLRARPCCVEQTRPARKDQVALYRLAGTQPWWMCAECNRAFNHQPKESWYDPSLHR